MRVERKTYLTVPHEDGKITFQSPPFKGHYNEIVKKIAAEGLRRPSSAETASLVHYATKNSKGDYESRIIDILKKEYLWEFTGNLHLPKKGVILDLDSQNLEFKSEGLVMDKNSLIKRLNEKDPNVKFVPFKSRGTGLKKLLFDINHEITERYGRGETESLFMTTSINPWVAHNNPYLVARYGREGVEKLTSSASHVTEYTARNLRLLSFYSVGEEIKAVSALGVTLGGILSIDSTGFGGAGAFVGFGGNVGYSSSIGYAFGIVKEDKE